MSLRPVPDLPTSTAVENDHRVQFYETDEFLGRSVADFFDDGLAVGDSMIIVATTEHRARFEALLTERGYDIEALQKERRYIHLEAEVFLSRFMADDEMNATEFKRIATELLTHVSQPPGRTRVFGEMVGVLWERGLVPAALRLETSWNELADDVSFSLLCGYPIGVFDADERTSFLRVCDRHSEVIPAESYSDLGSEDMTPRAIAELQYEVESGRMERDVLRAKQLELEDVLERLRETERSRQDFVSMFAHDIRNPIAAVKATLELLANKAGSLDEEVARDLIQRGLGSTERIESLLADMITVSELESGTVRYDLHRRDLGAIVRRGVAEVATTQPEGRFVVTVEDGLPEVMVDESRQLQILTNLLTNAGKFSPPDTPIGVDVALWHGRVVVSVTNEGPEIAQLDLERLFKPFSRLRQRGFAHVRGTGLGLYICKVLVEAHGGVIWAESREDRTTFAYSLPAEPPGPEGV